MYLRFKKIILMYVTFIILLSLLLFQGIFSESYSDLKRGCKGFCITPDSTTWMCLDIIVSGCIICSSPDDC